MTSSSPTTNSTPNSTPTNSIKAQKITICDMEIELDYPQGLRPSPHGKYIAKLLQDTFRDPKNLISRLLQRYKSPIPFKQFVYELYDQYWFSSGKEWQNVSKSVFLLFCAWKDEWSVLEALEEGVICRDGWVYAGLFVFYFIYTSRIRDRNSDGLLEWNEFKVLYPSLERILQCHVEWESKATTETPVSASSITPGGGLPHPSVPTPHHGAFASQNASSPQHQNRSFAQWFFDLVSKPDEDDPDTQCIPIARYMEVVFGTCLFASLMFDCDKEKSGQVTLDAFRNQFVQRLAPISRELQGRLERKIEQVAGIRIGSQISYEDLLKAMIVLDVNT